MRLNEGDAKRSWGLSYLGAQRLGPLRGRGWARSKEENLRYQLQLPTRDTLPRGLQARFDEFAMNRTPQARTAGGGAHLKGR